MCLCCCNYEIDKRVRDNAVKTEKCFYKTYVCFPNNLKQLKNECTSKHNSYAYMFIIDIIDHICEYIEYFNIFNL